MIVCAFAEVEEGQLVVLWCLEVQMVSPCCIVDVSAIMPVWSRLKYLPKRSKRRVRPSKTTSSSEKNSKDT